MLSTALTKLCSSSATVASPPPMPPSRNAWISASSSLKKPGVEKQASKINARWCRDLARSSIPADSSKDRHRGSSSFSLSPLYASMSCAAEVERSAACPAMSFESRW